MGQLKPGWIIASVCAVFVFISIGYGMGKKAGQSAANASASLAPTGAPLSTLQIEPIQPQEELNAITATPAISSPSSSETPTIASASEGSGAPTTSGEAERIRQIQLALRQAGFDPGPVDGRMGARTKVAIRDFQLANGLQADGKVGPRTWNRLESFYNQAQDPTKQQ